jgi:hypothetical protein
MAEDIELKRLELDEKRFQAETEKQSAELEIKREELKAKIQGDKRNILFSSPLIIGALSAVFGLLGTGVGASLQGYWNTTLERQKFESALIQKALDTTDKDTAKKSLLFLVKSGLIQNLNQAKIEQIPAEDLPIRAYHQAVDEGEITISEAKTILKNNGYYNGEINETNDQLFIDSIQKFQRDKKIQYPDGRLGLATNLELKKLSKENP